MKKASFLALALVVFSMMPANVGAVEVTPEQETALKTHCEAVKSNLQIVQRSDARARVYLGRYYETVLANYITPLNVILVKNNLSGFAPGMVDNQTSFAMLRVIFNSDYVDYQKSLEDLVAMNCAAEPAKFYDKLVTVREKRAEVAKDVEKLNAAMTKNKELATELKVTVEALEKLEATE